MQARVPQGVWILAGSVVIAVGSAMAGLYAFEDRVVPVMVGFLLFFAGYRLSQTRVHGQGGFDVRGRVSAVATPRGVARVLLLCVGGFGIALGVTAFTQTILDPSPGRAVLSGVSSVGGYMFAHVGMNGNLL